MSEQDRLRWLLDRVQEQHANLWPTPENHYTLPHNRLACVDPDHYGCHLYALIELVRSKEGSQAHEAEALLKGQSHEDPPNHDATGAALDDASSPTQGEVGGSDTARLQQIVECKHEDRTGGNDYMLCNVCGLMWDYRREQPHDMLVKLFAKQLDAQALALRTVQQERDSRIQQIEAGWKRREAEAVSVQVALQAECDSLRADVARLTGERDALRDENTDWILVADGIKHDWRCLNNAASGGDFHICWRCRTEHAEQQVLALREGIARMHAWNSDDMQIRHRQVVLAYDIAILLAAIKET